MGNFFEDMYWRVLEVAGEPVAASTSRVNMSSTLCIDDVNNPRKSAAKKQRI
jgi:hypothetical protein